MTAEQAQIRSALQAIHDEQERHISKLVTWREDIEGLLEAVESTLDRVETKRRSAAASASRMKTDAPAFDPTNRADLVRRAREMGITDAM